MALYGHANPDVFLDAASLLLKGASVTVRPKGDASTVSTIFSTSTGTAKANPFTTDSVSGGYDFYATPGHYDLWVGGVKVATVTVWPDPADLGGLLGLVAGGVTDNTTTINAALTAKAAAGGGPVVLPPGLLGIAGRVIVPTKVDLIGAGSAQSGGATVLKCTAAGAGVSFGDTTGGSTSGRSGGFSLNGNSVATNPLFVGMRVGATFSNIDIYGSTDVGLLLQGTQNCRFEEVNIQTPGLDAVRLDRGAGSNRFSKCEFGAGTRYSGNIVASTSVPLPGAVVEPLANVFDTCLFEYDQSTTQAMFHQSDGLGNVLINCIVAATGPCSTLIKMDGGSSGNNVFKVHGGILQFNAVVSGSKAFDLGGVCQVYQTGKTVYVGMATGVYYDGPSAIGSFDPALVGVTAWKSATGGAPYYNVQSAMRYLDVQAITGTASTVTGYMAVEDEQGAVKGYLRLYNTPG